MTLESGLYLLRKWSFSFSKKHIFEHQLRFTLPIISAITLFIWQIMRFRRMHKTTDSLRMGINCHSSRWLSTCNPRKCHKSGPKLKKSHTWHFLQSKRKSIFTREETVLNSLDLTILLVTIRKFGWLK